MNTLKRLQHYMGNRKILLPISMFLSALSALAGLLPFILIWLIVRELLSTGGTLVSGNVITYAWWATGLAVAGVLLYFTALMASHLAAFRVESNLRREAMRRIAGMPLGFFDCHTSGRIRKVIDDNASITHTFLAHQMPDLAGAILVPLVAVVLISFDRLFGPLCRSVAQFLSVCTDYSRILTEHHEEYISQSGLGAGKRGHRQAGQPAVL